MAVLVTLYLDAMNSCDQRAAFCRDFITYLESSSHSYHNRYKSAATACI